MNARHERWHDQVSDSSGTQRNTPLTVTDILIGDSEMAALMRSIDWAATPIGSVENWPQSLRTSVSICLHSRFPILIWWGPELVMLYNDAYRPILGTTKHPRAMGQCGQECWPEIWHIIGPMLMDVLATGSATWSDDQLLVLDRNGYLEECYFTFSYSPIRDESGGVGGVFCAVTETTQQVLSERRLRTLRDLADRTAQSQLMTPTCQLAMQALADASADIPFAALYLYDASRGRAHLTGTAGLAADTPAFPADIALDAVHTASGTDWSLDLVARQKTPVIIHDLANRFADFPGGVWPDMPDTALVLPVIATDYAQPVALLIVGISPRRVLDNDYRGFLDLVAHQIASAISAAHRYETEHQRAEALAAIDRAKTAFFANVSHEFRTPLTLMLGPLEDTLAHPNGLRDEDRERLILARRNALRLLKLVNTLLDFARIEAGRIQASYEPTDLAMFTADLAGVFRSAIERAGLRLVVACPPLSEPVYIDREMWEKIVFNLLSNALKFTFAGEITVVLRQAGDMVELAVRDTGTGIPAEEIPHVFDRFHRVKGVHGRTFEGSGIGLALVQELVKLHGGVVQIESKLYCGSTFIVSIPLGSTHLPAEQIKAARILASTGLQGEAYIEEALRWLPDEQTVREPMQDDRETTVYEQDTVSPPDSTVHQLSVVQRPVSRILLADDNADMRAYVQRLLSQAYAVVAVGDGMAALRMVRQKPFDLVLADVMMPQMDGFDLLRALRADERLKTLPVILLSARAGEEAHVEALEAGADDYLVKPFSAQELLVRIRARLEIARIRQEAEAATRESEERLRKIFEHAATGIAIKDWQGRFIQANPAYRAIVGYTEEELRRVVFSNLVHLDDRAANLLEIQRLMNGEIPFFQIENRYLHKSGEPVWVQKFASILRDETGVPTYLLALVTDITERKQAEVALRESQHFLHRLTETVPSVIYVYDLEANHNIYSNRQLYAVLGYTPEEARAMASNFLPTVIHPDDWAVTPEYFTRLLALKDGEMLEREYRIRHKNGEWRWFFGREMVFDRNTDGQPIQVLGSTLDITERKQVEKALWESEYRLRIASDAANIGIHDYDVVNNRVLWDTKIRSIWGVDADEEITYETFVAGLHPDDIAPTEAAIQAAFDPAGDKKYTAEYRVIHRGDGRERWVAVTGQTFLEGGKAVRLIGTAQDITEHKLAESDTHLLTDLSEYIRVSDDADALIATVVRVVGQYMHATHCYFAEIDDPHDRWFIEYEYYTGPVSLVGNYRLFDYPPEIVQTMRSGQLLVSNDTQADAIMATYYARAYEPLGIRAQVVVPLRRDGRWVANFVLATDTARQWQSREISLLETIAERVWMAVEKLRLEAEQRDYAARLQQLNAASLAINAATTRGEVLQLITEKARMLIGAHQAVTSTTNDQNWAQAINEVSLSEKYAQWKDNATRLNVSGMYVLVGQFNKPVRMTQAELEAHPAWKGFETESWIYPPLRGWLAVPLIGRDGHTMGLIQLSDKYAGEFTAADEALLAQLAQIALVALENQALYVQEQAARTHAEEASRLKDEFLATVSHELRTPLTAFLGYAQLLYTRRRDDATLAPALERMVRSAKAQAQLIEDLLDVSRIISGKLRIERQSIDLIAVIRAALDTVRPAIEAKHLHLHIDLQPEASPMIGDANRLQQVVWNLLSNATKFTPPGGDIQVRLETHSRNAQLTVSDTGQGINAAFLPYVFDRFRQADSAINRPHSGLGLGLAIVRHLVELHGGTVQVTSAGEGQGATFTVRLPLAIPGDVTALTRAASDEQAATNKYPPELQGLRVLIVDDQPDILELLQEMLTPCGSVVMTCQTAREGLDLVRTWQPDVLISDMAMPEEDGYWLIRHIRALSPQEGGTILAIALTAYVRVEDRMRVLAAGFHLYMPKPIEPHELRNGIAYLISA